MSDSFLGEIRMFAFAFAPKNWSNCEGQDMPIGQNQALFSLLGIQFGGDGRVNFKLPDYRGRVPVGIGSYSDYVNINYTTGMIGGSETVTLQTSNIPAHRHDFQAQSGPGNLPFPILGTTGNVCAKPPVDDFYGAELNMQALASDSVVVAGGGQSHNNIQPGLVMRFAMAIQGVYPMRN